MSSTPGETREKSETQEKPAARGVSSDARKFELRTLLALTGFVAALLVFLIAAAAVAGGDTPAFDEWIIHALREPGDLSNPIGPPWFEEAVRDVTALGSTVVLTFAVVVAAGYLWMTDAPAKAAFLIAAVSMGALFNRLLKFGFARPRPEMAAHAPWITTESFPSGHTANSAIIYLTLGMMLARVESSYPVKLFIFGVCVVVTLIVGMSRVYLGVHWPTDVVAGWAVGACWALLCWYALVWLQPSGARE